MPGAIVFGLGMTLTVPSLTSAALANAVDDEHAGLASGVNNAVARVGQLLAVALLPLAIGDLHLRLLSGQDVTDGVHTALVIAAGLMVVSSVISWLAMKLEEIGPGSNGTHPTCQPEARWRQRAR